MTNDKPAREWWIVETKSAYFIYEDEVTANKERDSQAAAYGYAEVHHTKSDYAAVCAKVAELEAQLKNEQGQSVVELAYENLQLRVRVAELTKERDDARAYSQYMEKLNTTAAALLAEAEAALEFYANYDNWASRGYESVFDLIHKDDSRCKDRDNDCIGGRRARETLARLREKKGGGK